MGQRFQKSDRVLRRVDFLAAQKKGRRVNAAHFTLVFFDRRDGAPSRLGLVTSGKVANAVKRNRVRRVAREVFRRERALFPASHDVIVIARDGAAALDSSDIRDEILGALARRRAAQRPGPTERSPARPPPAPTEGES